MGVKKGKNVRVDTRELEKFQQDIENLAGQQRVEFMEIATRRCAAQMLNLVIPNTPVGKSLKDKDGTTIHMGGALRRAWTCSTEKQAESGLERDAETYCATKALVKHKRTNEYSMVLKNPMHYASYVEFGHRVHTGKQRKGPTKWVDGQFFMTNAENDYRSVAPVTLQALLDKYLKKVF